MIGKAREIGRVRRGRTRSYHARGARARRRSFVTSTTIMLISPGTSAGAARGTGPPAAPSATSRSAPAAGKISRRAGSCCRRDPRAMRRREGSGWTSTVWRSGGGRRKTAVMRRFRPRGGDAIPIVKLASYRPFFVL